MSQLKQSLEKDTAVAIVYGCVFLAVIVGFACMFG
jgi:hypothetical protein